jgi:tripartite ATP-independent transporter DctP family solute receptor
MKQLQNTIHKYILITMGVSLLFSFLGNFVYAQTTKPVVFTLGGTVAASDPEHWATMRFADLVFQKTKGMIKLAIYPAGQLGGQRESIEAVRTGTLDMFVTGETLLIAYYSPIALITMPYMWNDLDHLHRFYDSNSGRELYDNLRKASGIRVVTELDRGARQITNSVRPINSVKDIEGLRIRVPEEPVLMEMFKAWGAKPTAVDWKEIYTSLSQGVVHGQDNGIDVVYGAKLYEVQKYFAFTDHVFMGYPIIMNDKTFLSLPEDFQKAILEAGEGATQYRRELLKTTESQNLKEMIEKRGMIVTHPDKSGFQEKVKDLWKTFVPRFGKDFEKYYLEAIKIK